jgi:Zn-dependent alcohol dehydrogenase
MKAAGVCHSDLHTFKGELAPAPPLVLGHEGAGIVEAVGEAVEHLKPGDRVMLNWLPACGACASCLDGEPYLCERLSATTLQGKLLDGTTRLATADGLELKHLLGVASMAECCVVPAAGVIPIPDDLPFSVAAICGCAVLTGIGAVLNTARLPAGRSAAIIGCGGVGLSALQGCLLSGLNPIIAVDLVESKLEAALLMGASHVVYAAKEDVVKTLRKRTGRGPDVIFDSVGSAATISQSLRAVRPGGMVVVIGLHGAAAEAPISSAALVLQNKQIRGSFAGSSRPRVDLPRIFELYRSGRLQLDELITCRYKLADLPLAFDDLSAGRIIHGVIDLDSEA